MKRVASPRSPGWAVCRPVAGGLAPAVFLAILSASGLAHAQEVATPAPSTAPVTREEYDALKKELDLMRAEIATLRQERAMAPATTQAGEARDLTAVKQDVATLRKESEAQQNETNQSLDELYKTMKEVRDRTLAHESGTTKLLITGDADVGFSAVRGSPSTFEAGVAPRFLWEISDRIMFDAAFDTSLVGDPNGAGHTDFAIAIANVSYIINNYLVASVGLFPAPFGQYHTHFDPSWINPLPDDPLVFSDGGLAPDSILGAMLSGAFPIGPTTLNYAAYVGNGPSLETTDPNTIGTLHFDNFTDLNNNKAVGGRIGFLPIPELEVGYSIQCAQVSPAGSAHTNVLLNAVDISYTKQISWLLGTVRSRAEWVWSNVGSNTYTPIDPATGNALPATTFSNDANGGYFLVSYRPTMLDNKILRNIEVVFRYDRLDVPSQVPSGGHDQRYAVGFDYWFDPRVVLKTAYECDDIANAGGASAFFVQIGVGF